MEIHMSLSLIFLFTLLKSSKQLDCFECTEEITGLLSLPLQKNINNPCGNFTDSSITTCPTGVDQCITVTGTQNGVTTKIHSCEYTEIKCKELNGTTSSGVSINCHTCSNDKCNIDKRRKCYNCFSGTTSSQSSNCENINDSLLVECSSKVNECFTATYFQDGIAMEHHGCATVNEDICKTVNSIDGGKCSKCSSDKCNGAIPQTERLHCYECNEGLDGFVRNQKGIQNSCKDFDKELVNPCPQASEVCVKIEGELDDISGSIHQCGLSKEKCAELEYMTFSSYKIPVKCYSCDENDCNSASNLTMPYTFFLVLFVLVKL